MLLLLLDVWGEAICRPAVPSSPTALIAQAGGDRVTLPCLSLGLDITSVLSLPGKSEKPMVTGSEPGGSSSVLGLWAESSSALGYGILRATVSTVARGSVLVSLERRRT